jgi:glycosyltransferase involved in cell wall biosynthesis
MRIVHLINSSETGIVGVERHVLYLAIAQKARGSSVTIIIDHPGALAEACQQHDIPVLVAERLEPTGGPLDRPALNAIQGLITQLEDLNAEVIHCHTLPAAAHAIPAGNRVNIPCVVTFNAVDPLLAARRAGMSFATICVSKSCFEDMKKGGLPENDIYYVPNGTRAVPLAPAPGQRGSHRPNLISVGSLITRKGVDNTILAMIELRRRLGQDCPALNIYGDGSQREYLQEMVAVLSLKDIVQFYGLQPDVLEHCAAADILVMSSRSETGPLVVLEAMSRGMPIVATDVGDVTEMLPDHRYGRIVPANSIIVLADAIESLLSDVTTGQFDPDLLIERHRSCYTDETMAERIEAVYEKVVFNKSTEG